MKLTRVINEYGPMEDRDYQILVTLYETDLNEGKAQTALPVIASVVRTLEFRGGSATLQTEIKVDCGKASKEQLVQVTKALSEIPQDFRGTIFDRPDDD